MPGIRTRPDELEPKYRALPMLAHGVGQLTTAAAPVAAESARRTSPACTGRPRNDSFIAPVAGAHRTQMTGATSRVQSSLRSYQRSERHIAKVRAPGASLARTLTAPGSAAVGPTPYGDGLLATTIPTLWEPRRRAQTFQGSVAERGIAHQMALIVYAVGAAGFPVASRDLGGLAPYGSAGRGLLVWLSNEWPACRVLPWRGSKEVRPPGRSDIRHARRGHHAAPG